MAHVDGGEHADSQADGRGVWKDTLQYLILLFSFAEIGFVWDLLYTKLHWWRVPCDFCISCTIL